LNFRDGKEGTVDFQAFFDPSRPLEAALLKDEELFNQYELSGGTLVWLQHGRTISMATQAAIAESPPEAEQLSGRDSEVAT